MGWHHEKRVLGGLVDSFYPNGRDPLYSISHAGAAHIIIGVLFFHILPFLEPRPPLDHDQRSQQPRPR